MVKRYDHDWYPKREDATFWGSWGCAVIGAFVVLALVLGVVAFAMRWIAVPGQIYSPENVRAQWQFAYDYEESLRGMAQQSCRAERLVQDARSSGQSETVVAQRQTQLIAIEQNYDRNKAEYDARLRDAFRAGWVKPPDVEGRALTLNENKQLYCAR